MAPAPDPAVPPTGPSGPPTGPSGLPTGPSDSPAGFEPGGLGRRLAALVIDWLLCVLVSALFADPRSSGWPPVVVLLVVNTLFVGLFGQTPGMAVARLRCVSVVDGGAVGLGRALLRSVLLVLIIPTVIMDDLRRGWHDRAAGSIVIATAPRSPK